MSTFGANGELLRVYDENNLFEKTSIGNGEYLITDVQYDDRGNLYCVNGYNDQVLKIRDKNGEWFAFDMGVPSQK